MRLQKYIADAGICSRREADRMTEEGRITVNGLRAQQGMKVTDRDRILIDGRPVELPEDSAPVVLAFHKPRGIVCTSGTRDRAPTIMDCIHYPVRVFPVGRLDKDSEGLILLTSCGEIVNRINRLEYGHEKEYLVECAHPVTEAFLRKMRQGVEIPLPLSEAPGALRREASAQEPEQKYVRVRTAPCKARRNGERSFSVILTQGMNRQIRRMCGELGNPVRKLTRVRIMNIELGALPPGAFRELEDRETGTLFRLLEMQEYGERG